MYIRFFIILYTLTKYFWRLFSEMFILSPYILIPFAVKYDSVEYFRFHISHCTVLKIEHLYFLARRKTESPPRLSFGVFEVWVVISGIGLRFWIP